MSVCGEPDWPFCQQPGLPNWFCCASTATCIPLAGYTTVLCCPNDQNCTYVEIIPCDLTLQDPSTQQTPPEIQTSELRGPLPECNTACCPWGYSCEDGYCKISQDQSKAPHEDDGGDNDGDGSSVTSSIVSPSTAPSSPASTTSISHSSLQESIAVVPTSQPSQEARKSDTSISTPTIIGTAIGGFIGLVLIVIIGYLARKLRQVKKEAKDGSAAGRDVSNVSREPKAPELEARAIHEMG
ncbi:hypothetical protein F4810DRAFT_713983 [Camillea tinctor]|nr:hypothetical protein F4810DRAFT_713983 [Camillea tinctor]